MSKERLTSIHIDTYVEDGRRRFMATGPEGQELGLAIEADNLQALMQKIVLVVPRLMEANGIWPKHEA